MSQKKRQTMSLNIRFYTKNTNLVLLHAFNPLVLGASLGFESQYILGMHGREVL